MGSSTRVSVRMHTHHDTNSDNTDNVKSQWPQGVEKNAAYHSHWGSPCFQLLGRISAGALAGSEIWTWGCGICCFWRLSSWPPLRRHTLQLGCPSPIRPWTQQRRTFELQRFCSVETNATKETEGAEQKIRKKILTWTARPVLNSLPMWPSVLLDAKSFCLILLRAVSSSAAFCTWEPAFFTHWSAIPAMA